MDKYIEYIYSAGNAGGVRYDISADYANSAKLTSIASSYAFDKPVYIFDDFVEITLDHPFKYSSSEVNELNTSAIKLDWSTAPVNIASSLNVYDTGYNILATAALNIHIAPAAYQDEQHNAHFVESIYGSFTQSATESEHQENQQWLIPITFKVGSYYFYRQFYDLDHEYADPNVTASDGTSFHLVPPYTDTSFMRNTYHVWGTTIPAPLFKEAGLGNIPLYLSSNVRYRLNTEIFSTLGNVGHIGDVQSNDFVKFANALLALDNCEIVSGTIKTNAYAASARVTSAAIVQKLSVKPYTILSADVSNNEYSVGVISNTGINALRYAFYDSDRDYKAITADNNVIYDEYTYYCTMPVSAYSTSAAATAAIQNIIDDYEYVDAANIDVLYYDRGTIQSDAKVFNFEDNILNDWSHEVSIVSMYDHGVVVQILPRSYYDSDTHKNYTLTAAKVNTVSQINDISTLITKPTIVTDRVRQISTTVYTYSFCDAYVVNSAFNSCDSQSNITIYKSDMHSMINYSSPEVAPVDQCRTTYVGYDTLCSIYFTPCDDVYRRTQLPGSSDIHTRNANLIPLAFTQNSTTTTHFENVPTRDIYFCITMSK